MCKVLDICLIYDRVIFEIIYILYIFVFGIYVNILFNKDIGVLFYFKDYLRDLRICSVFYCVVEIWKYFWN